MKIFYHSVLLFLFIGCANVDQIIINKTGTDAHIAAKDHFSKYDKNTTITYFDKGYWQTIKSDSVLLSDTALHIQSPDGEFNIISYDVIHQISGDANPSGSKYLKNFGVGTATTGAVVFLGTAGYGLINGWFSSGVGNNPFIGIMVCGLAAILSAPFGGSIIADNAQNVNEAATTLHSKETVEEFIKKDLLNKFEISNTEESGEKNQPEFQNTFRMDTLINPPKPLMTTAKEIKLFKQRNGIILEVNSPMGLEKHFISDELAENIKLYSYKIAMMEFIEGIKGSELLSEFVHSKVDPGSLIQVPEKLLPIQFIESLNLFSSSEKGKYFALAKMKNLKTYIIMPLNKAEFDLIKVI